MATRPSAWLLHVLLVLLAGTAGSRAAEGSWADGADAGRPFADLSRLTAAALVPEQPAALSLPVPFRFRGALYDTIELGADPGSVRLTWTEGGKRFDSGGLLVRAGGIGLRSTPGSAIQVRRDGDLFAIRFAGLVTPSGEPAGWDILVEPGRQDEPSGALVLQWLSVPSALRATADGVVVADLSRELDADGIAARIEPVAEGFALRAGSVLVLPGDVPWRPGRMPMTGCGVATNWCTVVTASDAGCLGSGGGDYSTCSTTEAKRWHFREGQYCRSCPYTFYVTVECGTEIHLPFRDMEGNQISITNVFTGVEMELEALNDCAKVPFQYCNFCATTGNGLIPDPAGTICPVGGPTPRIDCLPYLQRSTLVQWGWPLADRNGDTVADELPCGPPNTDTCNRYRSGAWPAHEEQNTDVILHGNPALCGVYRIDILSGGFDWYLSANCNGIVPDDPAEIDKNFRVYQNCSDALAAFDPVPELAITKLEFTGACPDIVLIVEVTNLGCVDAPTSPVHLDFERANQPDLDVDLGVVPAGSSVTMSIPVSLRATPQAVTATIDPLDVVSECTEQAPGSFSGCEPVSGADDLTTTLCSCANTVVPVLADDALVACNGASVDMDASASSALPCAGGVLEYRVLGPGGLLVRDWLPDPLTSLTPARCPSLESFTLQVRCNLETGVDCVRSVPFTLECAAAPDLVVASSASPVCQGDEVAITASPGFGSYVWETGESGRNLLDRPGATTTYRVTATTAAGCVVRGEVTVDVVPDPLPGPLGASLRVRKAGTEVLFTYAELPVSVGEYELVVHETDGTLRPCATSEPPAKPAPIAMEAARVLYTAAPGDPPPQLVHLGGTDACPRLLFYKVVATSPCRGTRGSACNGFPLQLLPCPR